MMSKKNFRRSTSTLPKYPSVAEVESHPLLRSAVAAVAGLALMGSALVGCGGGSERNAGVPEMPRDAAVDAATDAATPDASAPDSGGEDSGFPRGVPEMPRDAAIETPITPVGVVPHH